MHKLILQKDREYGGETITIEINKDSSIWEMGYAIRSMLMFLTFSDTSINKLLNTED